jgi:hypothetical protein
VYNLQRRRVAADRFEAVGLQASQRQRPACHVCMTACVTDGLKAVEEDQGQSEHFVCMCTCMYAYRFVPM